MAETKDTSNTNAAAHQHAAVRGTEGDSGLDHYAIRTIRRVIVIGLQSFGELHPSMSAEMVGDFADALAYMDHLEANLQAAA